MIKTNAIPIRNVLKVRRIEEILKTLPELHTLVLVFNFFAAVNLATPDDCECQCVFQRQLRDLCIPIVLVGRESTRARPSFALKPFLVSSLGPPISVGRKSTRARPSPALEPILVSSLGPPAWTTTCGCIAPTFSDDYIKHHTDNAKPGDG